LKYLGHALVSVVHATRVMLMILVTSRVI